MPRQSIPALPVPVKNLLELYGLEARPYGYDSGGFNIYKAGEFVRLANIHLPGSSVEDWISIVTALRREGIV